MKHRHPVAGLAVVAGLALTAGLLRATIFRALPSALEDLQRATEERLGIKKSVDTSFGLARVDESKTPYEVAVGELRSLWKGTWQLDGAKIDISRAQATELVLDQASAPFKFKVRWVAGNEALARKAKHHFQMKIVRLDNDKETVVETVKKDVSVDGKGFGATAFKVGHLYSAKMTAAAPAKYRIDFEARNSNTEATLHTSTVVEFKK